MNPLLQQNSYGYDDIIGRRKKFIEVKIFKDIVDYARKMYIYMYFVYVYIYLTHDVYY